MSRRHHHKAKPDLAAARERDQRRREVAAKLAEAAGVAVDDPRVEAASWMQLRLANAKASILAGADLNDLAQWQQLADQLAALLPPRAQELTVRFVDAGYCKKCKTDLSPEELAEVEAQRDARQSRRKPAAPKLLTPPTTPTPADNSPNTAAPSQSPSSEKAAPVPTPTNVVPITTPDGLRYGALYVGCALERNPAHGLPMDGRDSWDQRR